MAFDRKTLVIPEKTKFDEKTIYTKGDVVIGDRCLLRFGLKTDGRIFVGEHAIIDGGLEATKDIRVDNFSKIGGDVNSEGNVYFGEKCKIEGRLSLEGDLDVGDSVEIDEGFEANGWINIRSPIPITIYIFIYLLQLLKMGHSEEIDRILEEIEENNGETIPISEKFLYIPNNTIVGVQKSKIDYNLSIGKNSTLQGNYEVKGNLIIGDNSEINGSLKATNKIICGKKTKIKGNIDGKKLVEIGEKSKIQGGISAQKIYLSKDATVKGTLYGKEGVSFIDPKNIDEDKIIRFEKEAEIVDEVESILE
ncbi:MAG: polymer-forming cytoskeletal protein [Candidatus Thermoplasmatota archaeon]